MRKRFFVCAIAAISAASVSAGEPDSGGKAAFVPTSAYTQVTLSGFTVLISPALLEHADVAKEAQKLLEEKLVEIVRIVPAEKLKPILRTRFWLEWELLKNGAACAHHSVDWLTKNGYNPEKVASIEISNARNFINWTRKTQPMMVLHELAHIYHHNVLKADNVMVKGAYEQALTSGKYDLVEFVRGGKKRAYGMNNSSEYFAELSEAYFGLNDFYPFNYDELKAFDARGFEIMEASWGKIERAK